MKFFPKRRFETAYENNKRHGLGTYTYADGDQYVGEWKNNEFIGE